MASNHRQTTVAGLRGRLKRMEAKAFNLHMPQPLHAIVKEMAKRKAEGVGGQINMNKVIVEYLYECVKSRLTPEQRIECERFIAQL